MKKLLVELTEIELEFLIECFNQATNDDELLLELSQDYNEIDLDEFNERLQDKLFEDLGTEPTNPDYKSGWIGKRLAEIKAESGH